MSGRLIQKSPVSHSKCTQLSKKLSTELNAINHLKFFNYLHSPPFLGTSKKNTPPKNQLVLDLLKELNICN